MYSYIKNVLQDSTYGYSHFIHFKTVATEVEIQFLSYVSIFGSAFFSSKERGCPSTFVHIMNVQVIGVGLGFLQTSQVHPH